MPTERTRQYGRPFFVADISDSTGARALEPIALSAGTSEGRYSEGWLQRMLFRFPQSLPVGELEPGFGRLVPVALELPTSAGFVDNLYVTPEGNLVIAECKLWRNPEARREVVAQIIDYAHRMARWTYADLEQAVRSATDADGQRITRSLYEFVQGDDALDEAAFVDAVSRNLRLGRLLLLIVGDGIREGAETLVDYLQMHAGFHFTLGIVEAAAFSMPDGGIIMQPRLLVRTVNIERGIVRLTDDRLAVEPMSAPASSTGRPRSTSISEEQFFEGLKQHDPALVEALRSFLDRAAEIGVVAQPASKSLMIRWQDPAGKFFTLGAITTEGQLRTNSVGWMPDSIGRVDLAQAYLQELAALIGGQVQRTPHPANWYVTNRDKAAPLATAVLGNNDWMAVIQNYTNKLSHAQQAG